MMFYNLIKMINKFFNVIKKIIPNKWSWILEHDGFKRYFANTGWMFFGQIFSLLVSFFIGAWLARYLGPNNYGILSYAVAFVGLFAFLSDLGSSNIIVRDLVKKEENEEKILGTGLVLKIIGGFLAFLITSISIFFIKSDELITVLVIILSIGYIFQSISVINLFFQAKVKGKNIVTVQIIATIISSILKILFIVLDLDIVYIALIFTLDTFWQGILYFIIYKRNGFKINQWKFDSKLAKNIWNNSWPLMLSGAASYLLLKVDQVMIGHLLNNEAVGIYAVAVKITEIFYFIPGILCVSLFPAIINAKKTDINVYNNRLKNLYILMFLVALLIVIPLFLLAPWIINILFGSEYVQSILILKIYIWSSIGLFLAWAVNQFLIAENMVKTIFIVNLLSVIVNVFLNFIFIAKFGLTGAAWSTLISYFIIPVVVLSGKKFFVKYIR